MQILNIEPIFIPGNQTTNKNMMIILDNTMFDYEFVENNAMIGHGNALKDFLSNTNEWFENAISVQSVIFKNETMDRVCFLRETKFYDIKYINFRRCTVVRVYEKYII